MYLFWVCYQFSYGMGQDSYGCFPWRFAGVALDPFDCQLNHCPTFFNNPYVDDWIIYPSKDILN